jgi:hypothetical protein
MVIKTLPKIKKNSGAEVEPELGQTFTLKRKEFVVSDECP